MALPLVEEPLTQYDGRLGLTTLPDEIQQLIYRHVFPVNDITLLPDNHPDFVAVNLTQEFNIVGCPSLSLLLTNSKVCAVAKPVRDTSFTGRVNISRAKDLAHCGHWIHHNLCTIRLLSQTPQDPLFKLHLNLFTNLRKVEVTSSKPYMTQPSTYSETSLSTALLNPSHDELFIEDANRFRKNFFHKVFWQSPSNKIVIDVRINHFHHHDLIVDTKEVLGIVTRFSNCTRFANYRGRIVAKAFLDKQQLKYWEGDPGHSEPAPENDKTNNNVTTALAGQSDSNKDKAAVPIVYTTTFDNIPRRYRWVVEGCEDVEWENLD